MSLFFVVIHVCILPIIHAQDCTRSYPALPEMDRRARNYVVAANEPFVIDGQLQYQWYFVGKSNIPTDYQSVSIGRCGTYYPVWMNGTIPAVNDGVVNRYVCIMSFTKICSVSKTIQVRNCDQYMIYNLLPTSSVSAYCFDTLPDTPNITDAPTFQPMSAEVRPLLDFKGDSQGHKYPYLMFHCEFSGSINETLFYTVIWFVNSVRLLAKDPVLHSDIKNSNLKEEELTSKGYKLNINVQCGVRASKSAEGIQGNMTTSQTFWAGIKVLNKNVTIRNGGVGAIQLQLTVPFGCIDYGNDPDCQLPITMYDPLDSYTCQGTSITAQVSDVCGAKIEGTSFTEWLDNKTFDWRTNMTITTRNPDVYNLERDLFVLKLKTPDDHPVNTILLGNYIGDIRVQVEPETAWVRKNCYTRLDPHMWTFDQKNYENQNIPGEFILYRHKTYRQEVQIKTYLCYKNPSWVPYDITCVCAVSVRAGGELFIVDVCSYPVLIKHVSCKEETSLITVTRINQYLYEIHMPLGTTVVVSIVSWPTEFSSLNIDITPSVKDSGKTEGLCGVLNNNPHDDFTKPSGLLAQNEVEFTNSWRINFSSSFLNPLNHDPDYWEESSYLCICPRALQTATKPPSASGDDTHPLCSPSIYRSCTTTVQFVGDPYKTCTIQSKRSAISHSKEIWRILSKRDYKYDTHLEQYVLKKRSTVTYTMEEARSKCEEIFNRSCQAVKFEGIANNTASKESALRDCIFDLYATSDLHLADIHCSSFSAEAERYIRQDSVTRMAHSKEVDDFYASSCVNNCNGHGNCTNGTCVCHDPYIEDDCSISKMDHPDVVDTYSGGFCSKYSDQCCGTIPIYGKRFVEGVTKEKLDRFEVFANGTLVIRETNVRDLHILNAFEAYISIPCESTKKRSTDPQSGNTTVVLASGSVVSLSNDGINYGSNQSYYIYNGKCVGYESSTNGYIFYVLNETCYINGVCYSQGDKDPTDSCRECIPTADPYSFTGECTSISTNLTSSTPSPAPSLFSSSSILTSSSSPSTSFSSSLSSSTLSVTYQMNQSTQLPSPLPADNVTIVIAVASGVAGMVILISVILIIKCCLTKKERISGSPLDIGRSAVPEGDKLNKMARYVHGQNLLKTKLHTDRENIVQGWDFRPGTPGSVSLRFEQA